MNDKSGGQFSYHLGTHRWVDEWLPVKDKKGRFTNHWYKRCANPSCKRKLVVYNKKIPSLSTE